MAEEALAIQSGVARPAAGRSEPSGAQTGTGRTPTPALTPRAEASARPSAVEVDAVVDQLNEALQMRDISLTFSVDEASDRIVVTLTDEHTGDVIRKIPPDERLRIAAHLRELLGVLVNQTV